VEVVLIAEAVAQLSVDAGDPFLVLGMLVEEGVEDLVCGELDAPGFRLGI
jgi:hypothetical protein